MTTSEIDQKTVKRGGGRDRRSWFNTMRARAWVEDLMRRTGFSETKLSNTQFANEAERFTFGRYRNGETVPQIMVRETVHKYPPVAKSRFVFDIGPEEDGEFVRLWMLFKDRHDEFTSVIEDVILVQVGNGIEHVSQINQIAHKFLPAEQWTVILKEQSYVYKADNPVLSSWKKEKFEPKLRLLAAVIAIWRLCILNGAGVAPMEYLLHCLLAEPYKGVLKYHNIYDNVCALVHAIAVQNHAMQGNIEAASLAFSSLPRTTKLIKQTANAKKTKQVVCDV
jgi:hypothetical protein